jgi:hypothetical protein
MNNPTEWPKYMIWALTRDKLTSIMMYDVKHELQWVKDVTYESCMTCPKMTEAQAETQDALSEDIDF